MLYHPLSILALSCPLTLEDFSSALLSLTLASIGDYFSSRISPRPLVLLLLLLPWLHSRPRWSLSVGVGGRMPGRTEEVEQDGSSKSTPAIIMIPRHEICPSSWRRVSSSSSSSSSFFFLQQLAGVSTSLPSNRKSKIGLYSTFTLPAMYLDLVRSCTTMDERCLSLFMVNNRVIQMSHIVHNHCQCHTTNTVMTIPSRLTHPSHVEIIHYNQHPDLQVIDRHERERPIIFYLD